MTNAAGQIKAAIRTTGPVSLAEYMRMALTSPEGGYYTSRDPLGARGDFVTAPEISQIFGELIGVWCVDLWRQIGQPGELTLVELGPGRGTLMRDALRAAGVAKGFREAVSVALVEASPVLQSRQEAMLREAGVPVCWRRSFEEVTGRGPLLMIANEFFDALPVRQFVRTSRGWRERVVGMDAHGKLLFGAAPDPADALVPPSLRDQDEGAVVEISPARLDCARSIAERLMAQGGAALIVDYGYKGPLAGDTLQAVMAHAYCDVLESPGEADLTAHVDFAALAHAFEACGAQTTETVEQGDFLTAMGGAIRLEALKRSADSRKGNDLEAGWRRLTEAGAMGSLFKVMCGYAPAAIRPAGFRQ